jgi:hypothetical protein
MKYLFTLLFLTSFISLLKSQSLPSDAKVLTDVKKYHGKIASADVQNEWKLEKEAGYNFSNMAKRVVAATTVNENGTSKKIIGLAIYVRGGAGESWNFSRYFVTGSEVVGAKNLTEEDLKNQTIDLLKKDITKVFWEHKSISWVYDISFNLTDAHTDRTGDVIYNGFLEYDYIYDDTPSPKSEFEGGIIRYRTKAEAYVRMVDGQMKVAIVSSSRYGEVSRTKINKKQYDSMVTLTSQNFDQLFGPEASYTLSQETEKSNNDSSNSQDNTKDKSSNETATKSKKIGLPKIKIKGF